MAKKKYTALYIRVSTEQQNEEMQLTAAQNYIKDIPPDQLLIFIDHGVSALKVEINQRQELKKLLELIRQDKVSTLITYHRDRLARDFYEYVSIIKVLYKHDMNVIFTSFGTLPFHKDIETEAIYGILSQQEGLNIAKRTKDAQALNPNTIIGYEVIRDKNSRKRTYKIDSNYSTEIKQMFLSMMKVKSKNDFFSLLEKYKKILNRRNTDQVITLLQKPFYAGLKEESGNYSKINHVPPIIDQATFVAVQEVIESYLEEYSFEKSKEAREKLFPPICGVCNSEMKYIKKQLGHAGTFCCSKKHKKIMINYDELEEQLLLTTEEFLANLNFKEMELVCSKILQNKIKELSEKINSMKNQRKNIQLKIALNYSDSMPSKLIKQLTIIDQDEEFSQLQLNLYRKSKEDMTEIVKMINSYLNNQLIKAEKLILSKKLFNGIKVHHDYIEIEYFSNDFVKESDFQNVN